ncbi:MAG: putative sporulation protein YtxC [Bacillota bacterium]|nr:putative sporulation protein YtxC [Bacillota bacterium]
MFYELKIATAEEYAPFVERMQQQFSWLEERGYSMGFKTDLDDFSKTLFIDVCLFGQSNSKLFHEDDIIYIFKHQMSEFLAEHIVKDWETKLIWREIDRKNRQIVPADKQAIYTKASEFMRRCNSNESLNLLMNYGRKNKIAHRIFDHLFFEDKLLIEGIINFCMADYLKEIRFSVDLACEEMKNEKEYNEFVKLLRYFVDTQPSRVHEVNLLLENNGFYLWDGNGKIIEEEFLDYYSNDLLVNEINLDDILISILITIVPGKIVLHNIKSIETTEAVKMIRSVFGDRIVECKGCERCERYMAFIKNQEVDPIHPNH